MRFVPRIEVHGVQGSGWKWATVLHSHDGRACPECGALVIGANHRAQHQNLHGQIETMHEQLVTVSKALRTLASEAGHEDWYEVTQTEPIDGYVIGSGHLPAETRGGDD